jgi:hypothetical protein
MAPRTKLFCADWEITGANKKNCPGLEFQTECFCSSTTEHSGRMAPRTYLFASASRLHARRSQNRKLLGSSYVEDVLFRGTFLP